MRWLATSGFHVRQQQHEFVPAPAERPVLLADGSQQETADRAQNFVAAQMPQQFVEMVKIVQIEHGDNPRAAGLLQTLFEAGLRLSSPVSGSRPVPPMARAKASRSRSSTEFRRRL